MTDPPKSAPHMEAPPSCDNCGQPTTFVTAIQRLGSTPGYRIFECNACLNTIACARWEGVRSTRRVCPGEGIERKRGTIPCKGRSLPLDV
jgi:hypothetical protein